ncbi:hypothetical protein Vretifemale_4872, partial [Volvox reticuliferus]
QNLISTNDQQATSVMLSWVMLSPFVSLELLDRQQGVALGTTVPKLNQLLTALAGGFVIIGATIALGLHLKAVFLVWTTSLWAKSCVAILAIAAVGVLMEVVAGLNRRLRVAAAPLSRRIHLNPSVPPYLPQPQYAQYLPGHNLWQANIRFIPCLHRDAGPLGVLAANVPIGAGHRTE